MLGDELTPILHNFFQKIKEKETHPSLFHKVNITVILTEEVRNELWQTTD